MKSHRNRIHLYLNMIIAVLTLYAWLHMVFRGGGTFSSRGVSSLKYYTVLSNLFSAFTSILYLCGLRGQAMMHLKLTSSVSICLTLLTVLFFLGPIFGYPAMYAGDSFWLHLVIPVLCLIDYLLFEPFHPSLQQRLLTLVPTLIYGLFYTINVFSGRPKADWYGFFRGGTISGIFIYLILCTAVLLTGTVLTSLSDRIHK